MSSWAPWLCIVLLIGSAAAVDLPFVFYEKSSDIAGYSADQLEKISTTSAGLIGVPFALTPSDNETLAFPITGGGKTSLGTTEKKVADLKKILSSKVEADEPVVIEEAGLAAGKYSGDYTIEQVSAIYDHLKENWHYLRDPRGIDYFKNASESLNLGKKNGCMGVGDCDDFAILMSALVEATGGTTRIILAHNNTTGGHAYTEVYLGQLNATNNQVVNVIDWLKQNYDTDEVYTHIDTDTKDAWLNLDWGTDETGNAHPDGPFYHGDKHYILCIRDKFGKTSLKPPEKPNKPPKLISLTSDKPSSQDAGTAITWTAEARDLENDQIFYRFFLNDEPVTKWLMGNKWIWTTTDYDIGENQIVAQVRDLKHAGSDGFGNKKEVSFVIRNSANSNQEAEPVETAITTIDAPLYQSHSEKPGFPNQKNATLQEIGPKQSPVIAGSQQARQLKPVTIILYVHDGNQNGPAIPAVQVIGKDGSENSFEQTTDSRGSAMITGNPGTWSFSASAAGYETKNWSLPFDNSCAKHAFLQAVQKPEATAPSNTQNSTTQNSESCPEACNDYSNNCLAVLGDKNKALECYESAARCFENAVQQNPNNAECWYHLGNALHNSGSQLQGVRGRYDDANEMSQFDDAIKALDRAIELDPGNGYVWNEKGVIFEQQGKFDEAIKCFDKAIECDPQNSLVSLWRENRDRAAAGSSSGQQQTSGVRHSFSW